MATLVAGSFSPLDDTPRSGGLVSPLHYRRILSTCSFLRKVRSTGRHSRESPLDIDLSRLPYRHRFAAATLLMSKGNRLTELATFTSDPPGDRQVKRILEGLSYYDMALSLMKRMDPNYQTLLALDQIQRLADQADAPLPEIDPSDVDAFNDPPFCEWAEKFCWLLRDRKYKVAHRCLSAALRESMKPSDLQARWSSMVGPHRSDVDISLERFELASKAGHTTQIGWCYFSITNDAISEAVSIDVYRTPLNAFEVGALEFGRP